MCTRVLQKKQGKQRNISIVDSIFTLVLRNELEPARGSSTPRPLNPIGQSLFSQSSHQTRQRPRIRKRRTDHLPWDIKYAPICRNNANDANFRRVSQSSILREQCYVHFSTIKPCLVSWWFHETAVFVLDRTRKCAKTPRVIPRISLEICSLKKTMDTCDAAENANVLRIFLLLVSLNSMTNRQRIAVTCAR